MQNLPNNSKTVTDIKNLAGSKTNQHDYIYLPRNFEVILNTRLRVVAFFSLNMQNFHIFCHISQKH